MLHTEPLCIFENSKFLVVDKPHGWLTIPGRDAADVRRCLSSELSANSKLWTVHRLDVEVSGLVLFAKNPEAHRLASGWFEHREVQKKYHAWTAGKSPTEKEFEWKCLLARGKKRAFESPAGKESITHAVWTEERVWNNSLVQIWNLFPKTGRSHQLRFELSRHGYPILGDALYGSEKKFAPDAIALRAVELNFEKCSDATEKFGLPPTVRAAGLGELWEGIQNA